MNDNTCCPFCSKETLYDDTNAPACTNTKCPCHSPRDNKCCEKCFAVRHERCVFCSCHSPRVREEWEEQLEKRFTYLQPYRGARTLRRIFVDRFDGLKSFIATLLQEARESERERVRGIVEGMKWDEEQKAFDGFPLLYVQGRNAAIETILTALDASRDV